MTDAAFTALTLRGTDRLIGDCAAHVDADDPRRAEIGFTLAPEHQGHGYATEAVRRLLHYLLVERGKHRVSATCDARNTRSAALLERVGPPVAEGRSPSPNRWRERGPHAPRRATHASSPISGR